MTSQVLPTNVPSKNRADVLRLAARMAEEAELIGGRIAELRDALDLTQRELAEKLPGSTQGADVSRWETGRHRPAQETLPHIAKALKTTVADLHLGPMGGRKIAEKKKGPSLLDQLSAPDAKKLAEELAELGEEIAGIRSAQESATGLLEGLGGAVRSVQDDLAILKRRRAG